MTDRTTLAVVSVAIVVGVSAAAGIVLYTSPAAAQSVSDQRNIASHADSTTQKFSFEFDLPPASIECTLETSNSLGQHGITLKSASVSGTDKLSMSVTSGGDVTMTIQSGQGTETATVTLTMSTEQVTIPDEPPSHQADCSTRSGTSASLSLVETQANGFEIKETGIQNTSATAIHNDDSTIENDTTLTQSVDLDLVVPDDGDADGDTYNVTIDTREALANGINVTGAALETDPSGADSLVEVVDVTVEDDENVTVTIREASADRNNGNVSRETVTVALTLDGTTHDAGTFIEDSSIAHVITDEAGNTTSTVTFSSTIPDSSGPPQIDDSFDGPPTNPDGDSAYEDVNGNGQLDIGDVQALFANQNSDAVQSNVDAFDFNGNGGIDIGDIQALFVEQQNA